MVRALAAEDTEMARQRRRLAELREAVERRVLLHEVYRSTSLTIITALGVVVLLVGGLFVINDSMTLGGLFSFYTALALLRGPLSQVAGAGPAINEGAQSLERIFELLDHEHGRPYDGTESFEFDGRVSLADVTFGYGDEPLLTGVDLDLRPATVTALTGANGAGKTTVVNLILGFYRPAAGRLLASDRPYDTVDMGLLRSRVGVVPQEPIVFSGSVGENIAYGKDWATPSDIVRAAELAGAHDFVMQLPDTYDSPIGHEGALLSGGLRQRLAIARALVGEPQLLILDEPTNHLDPDSTVAVLRTILELEGRPAILLVSHRPEVLAVADVTYRLAGGVLDLVDTGPRVGRGSAASGLG